MADKICHALNLADFSNITSQPSPFQRFTPPDSPSLAFVHAILSCLKCSSSPSLLDKRLSGLTARSLSLERLTCCLFYMPPTPSTNVCHHTHHIGFHFSFMCLSSQQDHKLLEPTKRRKSTGFRVRGLGSKS